MKKIVFIICLMRFSNNCFCQNNSISIDSKITSEGKFESSKAIAESFLKSVLIKNADNFSDYYNVAIFCALITEEIADSIPENKIHKEDLCKEEVLSEIFTSTIKFKRNQFFSKNEIDVSNIKVINFRQEKINSAHTSKYKFDQYVLYLKFQNISNKKTYELNIFDVYHINYKWFILDPSFEIL
jgi:hypothetical protein